jgi:aminopeptidase N
LSAPLAKGLSGVAPNWNDCEPRAADVSHHSIDLQVELAPPSIVGSGDVRVRMRRAARFIALDARALRISQVAAHGVPLRFRQASGHLCVELPQVASAGSEIDVRLSWLVPTGVSTPHFAPDQVWAGYDAAAWMPTLQDPAQRATLELRLTVPSDLKVVASGRRLPPSSVAEGRVTHSYLLERPTAPFLYAFAVGRFAEAELDVANVKLRALGPYGSDLRSALALTAPMLRFYVDKLGAEFPSAEYTQVFVHGDAAQEAAGFSLLSASSLETVRQDPTEDWIFSHELAHQWFAWLVPCADFADFWLNEGFATFLVAAVKEQRWGRAAYDREVELWRRRSAKVHAEGHDAPLSRSAPGVVRVEVPESALPPRGITYARGALVLHRLRNDLGDAAFWSGLRRYVAHCAGKGARSEDLRIAMEATSGRDLRPFFDAWVYAPAPEL